MTAQAALRILHIVRIRPVVVKKPIEIPKEVHSRIARVRRILLVMKDSLNLICINWKRGD